MPRGGRKAEGHTLVETWPISKCTPASLSICTRLLVSFPAVSSSPTAHDPCANETQRKSQQVTNRNEEEIGQGILLIRSNRRISGSTFDSRSLNCPEMRIVAA